MSQTPAPPVPPVPIDRSKPPFVLFGCGYVGTRLARALLAEGIPVRICSRRPAKLEALRELGADVHPLDASKHKQFGPALLGLMSPTVVYSIPPVPDLPGGEAARRASQAALNAGARSFILLASAGVYGKTPDTDWIDEDTGLALSDPDMAPRHADEGAVSAAASAGLRTTVLRLAPVYGPGRGVRQRLLKGDYKLLDDGQHWASRIHVDDVVQVIRAAAERAQQGAVYLVADDRPTQQREYAEWLCARLGLPVPPAVPSLGPGVSRLYLRGRRIRNARMKQELGVTLRYPTFVEGEAQIEAEAAGASTTAAAPPPVAAPLSSTEPAVGAAQATSAAAGASAPASAPAIASAVPAGPSAVERAATTAAARPACIRAASSFVDDGGYGDGQSDEKFAPMKSLARGLGLKHLSVLQYVLPPGTRTSLPHAHSIEEELVYVLAGTPDVWLDGATHRLAPGDVVALAAGTGIAHTILNDSDAEAVVLLVGEDRPGDRLVYPLDMERERALPNEQRWIDGPRNALGTHDALPAARRRP